MKTLEYFETLAKIELETRIREDLKKGPVPITVDCTIKKESDLQKSSVQFSLRRTWRKAGHVEFEKSKLPILRFLTMGKNLKLNGIPLEDGIILPIFAPEILDDVEITTTMMREGLILNLYENFDSYYYRVLIGFDLSDLPEKMQEEIRDWGKDDG